VCSSDLAIEVENVIMRVPKPRGYWEMLRHPRGREEIEILHGITLSVPPGEVVGLLGPNGAGKTTLIKLLCTLLLPSAGTVRVNGYDAVRDADAVRRSIGYVVADERSFHWRLTGRQNLRFFATLNNLVGKDRERRIDEVVALVGLEPEIDRPFLHYSTGTRQKLAIARGLLTAPPILLLDEPTRSLDLPSALAMRRFVRTMLADRGRTVLIATHNMEEASELCSRIAMIDGGRLRAWGTPSEITATGTGGRLLLEIEGRTEEALRRLRCLPSVQCVRSELVADGLPSIEPPPNGNINGCGGLPVRIEVELAPHGAGVPDVIEAVVLSGCRIRSVEEKSPTLADLFLRMTAGEQPSERELLPAGAVESHEP